MASKIFKFYNRCLDANPGLTKMCTGLSIVGGGDVIAQLAVENKPQIDQKRLLSLSLYGFFIAGGVGHLWYKCLDHAFGAHMTLGNAFKKILIDQGIFAPLEIIFFFAWTHFFKEESGFLKQKINEDLKEALIVNYKLWIPGQFLNFYMVPEKYRVLFSCGLSVVWFTFISYLSHTDLSERSEIMSNKD